MIKSFRHKGLEKFFRTGSTVGIQHKHVDKLQNLLTALDNAKDLDDLAVPAWRLHLITGYNPKKQSVEGHYSLHVNANWRITFTFEGNDVILTDYMDYH